MDSSSLHPDTCGHGTRPMPPMGSVAVCYPHAARVAAAAQDRAAGRVGGTVQDEVHHLRTDHQGLINSAQCNQFAAHHRPLLERERIKSV